MSQVDFDVVIILSRHRGVFSARTCVGGVALASPEGHVSGEAALVSLYREVRPHVDTPRIQIGPEDVP